jgi:hypothetical protein
MIKYKFIFLMAFLGIIISLGFVFAEHLITSDTDNANEDVSSFYNISVNNSDISAASNITQVNITVPASFVFTADSNGTTSTGVFSNSSNVLSWDGDGLVMNLSKKYFWFNATASTPGEYNLTITTTNSTYSISSNITVTINDTTEPSLEFVSPTEENGSYLSQDSISYNITASDNSEIDTIVVKLYNSTHEEVDSDSGSASPVSGTFSSLGEGTYYLNATINDSSGNQNSSETRIIVLDTTPPEVTISEPDDGEEYDGSDSDPAQVDIQIQLNEEGYCNYSYSDIGAEDVGDDNETDLETDDNISFNKDDHEFPEGDYILAAYCTDLAGNANNSVNVSFEVQEDGGGGGGSSTSSNNNNNFWYLGTFVASANAFEEGYSKLLIERQRIRVVVDSSNHHIGVVDLTSSVATINVSSDPQQEEFNIGDEKKFEVTGDGYYDILVILNNISSSKANITVKKIHEEVPQKETVPAAEPVVSSQPEDTQKNNAVGTGNVVADNKENLNDSVEPEKKSNWFGWLSWFGKLWNSLMWVLIGLIIMVFIFLIIAVSFYLILKKLKNKKISVRF